MVNLYEAFGCKDKEELYQKVKSKDESVMELTDFLDYAKDTLERKTPLLNQPENVVGFLNHIIEPNKDEIFFLFLDSKSRLTNFERASADASMKEVLKEALSNSSRNCILAFAEDIDTKKKHYFERALKLFDYSVVDKMAYREKEQAYFSSRTEKLYDIDDVKVKKREFSIYQEPLPKYEGYQEFVEFYLEKEIIGLHVTQHEKRVKKDLKLAFQNKIQEESGLLLLDENQKILSIEKLSLGTVNASLMPPKNIYDKILKNEKVKSFIVFHNHPSGDNQPSNQDKVITRKLLEISKIMDVEFADHFILAKHGVYSFAEDSMGEFEFNCKGYNDYLMEKYRDFFEEMEAMANEEEMEFSL